MQAMPGIVATADVALLQLARAAQGKTPAALGLPNIPINVGSRFTIAGIGVTVRGDGKSGGTIRVAGLVATGKPGTLQIRLVDPVGQGTREGLGACTGDSGAPVFEDKQGGPVIVGVVSWSTGPNGAAGCGGMTGVTPLTLYRDWTVADRAASGDASCRLQSQARCAVQVRHPGASASEPRRMIGDSRAVHPSRFAGYAYSQLAGRRRAFRTRAESNAPPPCSRRRCSARSGRRRRRRACC